MSKSNCGSGCANCGTRSSHSSCHVGDGKAASDEVENKHNGVYKSFDVVIIGAGVIGNAIARELSKYDVKIAVLEKELDICQGATKANSGIVHGGYDAQHGTLKSKLSRKGNRKFKKLCEELNFGYREIGSFVLAFTEPEERKLEELMENGRLNGVDDLDIIPGDKVREMEPHISIGVRAALYCPTAGIVAPYEYGISLAENAMANGVQYFIGDPVSRVEQLKQLGNQGTVFHTHTETGKRFVSRFVVNCAGLYADKIAKSVGAGLTYDITPRKGQYVLLEKGQGHMATRVIFQTPTDRWGKGILVSPTFNGNLLLGPSAAEQDDKEDKGTDMHELAYVAWAARRSVPHLDTRMSLTNFSGLRARGSLHDFVIQEDPAVKQFVHVACIESPGLTSSPAIAEMVLSILKSSGLQLTPNNNFNPFRRHPVEYTQREKPGTVVCKCENVTDAEIRAAIQQAGLPITSTDSVKWRTRCGMGHCQGARCRPEVAEIVSEELERLYGEKVAFQDVPKEVKNTPSHVRVSRNKLAKL